MFDVIGRLAACFTDHRDPSRVEHTVEAMLRQRVFAICLGYEDVNDHDRLRDDPVLAMGVGCEDVTGALRARERDQGHPLASSSTLNRLELGSKEAAVLHRYKRIVADPEKIDTMLADLFMDVTDEEPESIVLDLDATDDAIHGHQEGRFFHGYYGHYCYLPLYIVTGKHVLAARLRPSNIDASAGTIEELAPVVARIRARWPQVPIWIRADAGFCRDDIMAWCEAQGLHYIIGMPRNARLQRIVEEAMQQSQATCEASGQPSRRFRSFEYRMKDSWSSFEKKMQVNTPPPSRKKCILQDALSSYRVLRGRAFNASAVPTSVARNCMTPKRASSAILVWETPLYRAYAWVYGHMGLKGRGSILCESFRLLELIQTWRFPRLP